MNYLERFKQANPAIAEKYSDDIIIDALPQLLPDRFGGLSGDDLIAQVTLEGNDLRRYELDDGRSQIRKGLSAGVDQMQALGGGLLGFAGDLIGSDGLRDYGMDMYNRNMEEAGQSQGNVQGFTDIAGVEDAVDWALYTAGNLIPSMATTLGSGGVGGIVANVGAKKAAQTIVAREIAKGVTAQQAAKIAAQEVAKRYATGTTVGAGAAAYGMGTGTLYGETGDVGITAAHAPVFAVAEALPALRILSRFGPAGEAAAQKITKNAVADIATQGMLEGSTEAIQTMVEQHANYWLETEGQSLLANLGEVERNDVINAFAAGALGGSIFGAGARLAGRKPTDEANEEVEKAGADVAAQGGDALSQESAKAQVHSQVMPNAMQQEQAMPQQQDYSAFDTPAMNRESTAERGYEGLDGLITLTERMGFTDEASLLITAKRLFTQADQARAEGNNDLASMYVRQGNDLYRKATEANETIRTEAAGLPVPYVFDGQVEGGQLATATQPQNQFNTFDQQPDPLQLTGTRGLLGDSGIIYGQEPTDVTAARQQREADDFNARYGQEGVTPFRTDPLTGELDRSGELPAPSNRLGLPQGTGQIDLGRDRPNRTFTPTPTEFDGVGRNVVERQTSTQPALPQGRNTITSAQYQATMDLARQAIRTPVSQRTPEMNQAVEVRQAVRSGEITVSDAATPQSSDVFATEQAAKSSQQWRDINAQGITPQLIRQGDGFVIAAPEATQSVDVDPQATNPVVVNETAIDAPQTEQTAQVEQPVRQPGQTIEPETIVINGRELTVNNDGTYTLLSLRGENLGGSTGVTFPSLEAATARVNQMTEGTVSTQADPTDTTSRFERLFNEAESSSARKRLDFQKVSLKVADMVKSADGNWFMVQKHLTEQSYPQQKAMAFAEIRRTIGDNPDFVSLVDSLDSTKKIDSDQVHMDADGTNVDNVTQKVISDAKSDAIRNANFKNNTEVKQYLNAEIDRAISEATIDSNADTFVEFAVPGDGVFRVKNSVAELKDFKRKVNGVTGQKSKAPLNTMITDEIRSTEVQGSGSSMSAIKNFLVDGELENAINLADSAGIPYVFHRGKDAIYPVFGKMETIGGVELLMGQFYSGKTTWYAAADPVSGNILVSSKKEADVKTKLNAVEKKRKGDIERVVSEARKRTDDTQESLRNEFNEANGIEAEIDLLQEFLTPPTTPNPEVVTPTETTNQIAPETQRDLDHIDSMIERRKSVIEEVEGRVYKENDNRVTVGDPEAMAGDSTGAKTLSIGEINERKRRNNVRGIRDSIKDLEKLKQQITEGKTTLGDRVQFYRDNGLDGMAQELDRSSDAAPATQAEPAAVIEDTGQKLGGARKDEVVKARERLENMTDEDIAKSTLATLFPKSELDSITDNTSAALYHSVRAEIPSKPRKSYKLQRWVDKVKEVRQILKSVEDLGSDKFLTMMREQAGRAMRPFVDRVELLSKLDRNLWDRVGKVEAASGRYNKNGDGNLVPGSWFTVEIDGRNQSFYDKTSVDQIVDDVQKALAKPDPKLTQEMKFEIRTYRSTGIHFINKTGDKDHTALATFDSLKDARDYLRNNNADLVQAWEAVKERENVTKSDMRGDANIDRTGVDYRDGKDIAPQEFIDTFGFRGVEFGNWVKQGAAGKERQGLLNQAYDGFMDLAKVLGVPPKSLSLNGILGISFGSRGRGKANAHYEPGAVVINLTKTKGAGSLAHEWFHAMDNYFGAKRDLTREQLKQNPDLDFVTFLSEPMMVKKDTLGTRYEYKRTKKQIKADRKRLAEYTQNDPDQLREFDNDWVEDPNHPKGVRPVVEKAFADLVQSLDESPMNSRAKVLDRGKKDGYWSTIIERGARAFETHIIHKLADQGYRNDFLANVTRIEDFRRNPEKYPYLKPEEQGPVTEAFDKLFATIETRTDEDGNVALFSMNEGESVSPISREELSNTIRTILPDFKDGDNRATIVDTFDRLPDKIKQDAKDQGSDGQNIEGVFHDGTIYLIADKITSKEMLETLLFHEGTHGGVNALYADEGVARAMNRLYAAMGGSSGFNSVVDQLGLRNKIKPYIDGTLQKDSDGQTIMRKEVRNTILMQELLAYTGEKGSKSFSLRLKELVGAVRNWLRKNGFMALSEMGVTDIAHLAKKARERGLNNPGSDATTYFRFGDMVRGAMESVTGRNNPEPDGYELQTQKMTDTIVRKFQDKYKVLKDVQSKIQKQGGKITEESNAYQAEELFHGKTAEDLDVITKNMVEPFAKLLAKHKIDQADLDLYLMAKHAQERNAHIASINPDMPDGGSGLTNAQAQKILDDVASSGKQAQYDEIAQIVYDMTANRRSILTQAGLLDQSEVDAWESKYQFYVPLKGWAANETQDGRPRTGRGLSIGGKETKRALGRSSQAASPSSYAIVDLTESIVRKRKNEVGQAFLKLVQDNPDANLWQVFTDENPEKTRTIKKRKDENGNTVEEVTEQVVPMAMFSDRYFTTKVDGKTHYIKFGDNETGQLLLKAMNNVGPETHNAFTQIMGGLTRFMSAMNTSYNPEFVIGNFARDVQTAILNLTAEQSRKDGKIEGERIAKQTVKDIPKAMRAVYRGLRGKKATNPEWQQWYDEFRQAGAQTGYYDMKDIDGQIKDVERMVQIAEGGFVGGFHKWRKAGAQVVEDMNSAVENAVRLSAYVNARKAGVSQAQAASLAKNMTVNFNRRGEMGTLMNSLYMFFNASVQGTANFARTMFGLKGEQGDPMWKRLTTAQKIAAGMAMGAYALAFANREAAGEDEDGENWYDKVPGYVRERNLVIMKSLFGGPQDGSYWKIPLPYGYNIFAVFGENAQAVTSGNRSISQTSAELAMGVVGSFHPLGYVGSDSLSAGIMRNITPSIGKPIADLVANENFMGTSIYNENFPFGTPKPDSQLARRSTPEGYKAVAEWLNDVSGGSQWRSGHIDINPDAMRYMVDYFTGGAGAFFTSKAPDYAVRKIEGVEVESHRTPFLSRVNGRVLPYEDQSQFYDRRDEINQINEEMKAITGTARMEFARDNRELLALRPLIKATEDELKALRKRRDAIQGDTTLSPREKDQRLKEVEALMKRSVDRFNRRYNQINAS